MAGGPGLLPGSLPASQAPGQGCNHSGPGGRRGETGQAGPPGQATGGMLPCCGLSTRLGRAVCQGLQVPAWIPAPSQGDRGKQGTGISLSPDAPASPPPDLSSGGLGTPALPTLPGPRLAPRQQGLAQVLDRTLAPGPNAAAPCPEPQGLLPPLPKEGSGLTRVRDFRGQGRDTFQTQFQKQPRRSREKGRLPSSPRQLLAQA